MLVILFTLAASIGMILGTVNGTNKAIRQSKIDAAKLR